MTKRTHQGARRVGATVALLAAGALAACVAMPTAVDPGAYTVADGYTVELERTWTEMPETYSQHTDMPYLTFDGPQLNQVHLVSGVTSGMGIITQRADDDPVPVFRADMTSLEIVEFVTESVTQMGVHDVAPADIRPAMLAGAEGVRFEFTGAQENGLRLKGAALAAESEGALDLMLFVAPEEHYFDAFMPEVDRMFASAAR